ncbi:hypothetical protein GGF49_000640 [Coemansia sp. RSA 1853]|nr:hypothetical protein GGF49_000640 [Coemansia sp. RSA 1853]
MQSTVDTSTRSPVTTAELGWLLEHSIPENICLVGKHISNISFLKDPAKGATDTSQTSLLSDDGTDIKGTAVVLGTRVTQLSLTLPSVGQPGQGTDITVYMKKGETLALKQAQDSRNYIKSTLRWAQSSSQFDTRDDALVFVERMLNGIQRAKNILVADNQHGLMPLQSGTAKMFAPALPDNMVVECSISGCDFVTRVYWLKFRRDAKSTGILDAFTKEPSTGHVLVYDGRLAEVKKETVYKAKLEDLQGNLDCLDRAAGVCIDIIGQLNAFSI